MAKLITLIAICFAALISFAMSFGNETSTPMPLLPLTAPNNNSTYPETPIQEESKSAIKLCKKKVRKENIGHVKETVISSGCPEGYGFVHGMCREID